MKGKTPRVVFMGTPAYAVPALEVLVRRGCAVWVVTRPDRPFGRHRRLAPSPVRARAEELGLPVLTPRRLGPKTRERLAAAAPALLITAAYGLILPSSILALASAGAYNLHASLLPRWRGANPIAWAIRAGDRQTGVSLMAMAAGVDTGPIAAQTSVVIAEDDTTGTLTAKLSRVAADLLDARLEALLTGAVALRPQTGEPTYAPKFAAGAERVDWTQPADVVSRQVRSMLPEPGPYTTVDGERVRLLEVRARREGSGEPGVIVQEEDLWLIACGTGSLEVRLIQPAGRRPMTPGAYARGRRTEIGRAW